MNPIESIRSSITASRALCAAATPGPWAQDYTGTLVGDASHHICKASPSAPYSYGMRTCGANTSFIAHARDALPAHVDALELAVAALEKCNAKIKQYEATQPEHDSYYAGPKQMRDWGFALQEVYELPDSITAALAKIAERLK